MTAYPWMAQFRKNVADPSPSSVEVERLAGLVQTWTAKIRAEFLDAVKHLAGRIDVDAIAALLRDGRIQEAIAQVDLDLIADGMAPIAHAVTAATVASGVATAADVISALPALAGAKFSFGVTNPSTIATLQTYEFGLIRQLTDTTRQQVATAIRSGVTAGRNPLDTARDVRAFIGLTDRQAQAVVNFRRALQEAPNEAMDRELRDKRFDATLARAAREGAVIDPAKIDTMVDRYRQRYLRYRSETIARTESIRAIAFGNIESWRQAIAAGKVAADAVTKRWIYTHDSKTRHAHRTIPGLNPKDPGIDGNFNSELGPIAYPGDPEARAGNICNCRCAVVLRYRSQE